ncbi:hypothetical protein NQ318_021438 [Aromia moschata]|uniref:Uncharacterized protein n=1 Tax=Aromia moschata TaxID=1265417 RepID=A0AAV8ZD03_9CUCU|nr:hypothetical protein NQ318_021438 [Aromia moschata]
MYRFSTLLLITVATAANSGPYESSGWRPSGPQFLIPLPQTAYGPPFQEYGPPQEPTTTESTTAEPESSTTEESTTTEEVTEPEDFNSVGIAEN